MYHTVSYGSTQDAIYLHYMELSLIVPSFKQAATIRDDLRNITTTLESISNAYEIILVVDGNIDHTVEAVRTDPGLSHIIVRELTQNRGKGAALRDGLAQARGNIIGFIDAGNDIEISSLPLMLDMMKFSNADIVIGSKRHVLSKVSYPPIRRIYSSGYQLLNRILFRLHVKDTQVGLKIFRCEVIHTILPHITIDRFAFDLELLVIATLLGYKKIIESPISITHKFQSTISIKTVFETLIDTLGLYRKIRNKKIVPLSPGIEITRVSQHTSVHEHETS